MCDIPMEHSIAGQEMNVEQKKRRKHCRLCIWPGRQDTAWLWLGCESCSLPGTPARKLHKAQSERPSLVFFLHIDRCPSLATCHAREKLQRWQKMWVGDYACFSYWFPLSVCREKIGELLRYSLGAVRDWEQWSLEVENTGGGRKSYVLFLPSSPCPYWLFTLTQLILPLPYMLVKHLTEHGSWRFPEWFEYPDQIPDQLRFFSTNRNSEQGNEGSFLKRKCYCVTSWKNKYLLRSFCIQGAISTGISAWSSLGNWAFDREAFAAVLQYIPSLKQMGITSEAP